MGIYDRTGEIRKEQIEIPRLPPSVGKPAGRPLISPKNIRYPDIKHRDANNAQDGG
jgi:hypothetical protein